MARVVSKKHVPDPKWLTELVQLATSAMWNSSASAEAVQLRNKLKRNKGFGNITGWKILTGSTDYDEMGMPYGHNDRIVAVKFWKFKKEWLFP